MSHIVLVYGDTDDAYGALTNLQAALNQYENNQAKLANWNDKNQDWQAYDAVIIRSTWDYHLKYAEYKQWLHDLKKQQVPLHNAAELILGNLEKSYLKDLESKGIPIIPTELVDRKENNLQEKVRQLLTRYPDAESFIIKPAISAGAFLTSRIDRKNMGKEVPEKIKKIQTHSAVLIQPFMTEILTQGELSMVFLNGQFKYAINKKPATGDFRSQYEHGGHLKEVKTDKTIREQGQKILDLYDQTPLYARIDGIVKEGHFHLMELEINEPDIYEHIHPPATKQLAEAIMAHLY